MHLKQAHISSFAFSDHLSIVTYRLNRFQFLLLSLEKMDQIVKRENQGGQTIQESTAPSQLFAVPCYSFQQALLSYKCKLVITLLSS